MQIKTITDTFKINKVQNKEQGIFYSGTQGKPPPPPLPEKLEKIIEVGTIVN